MKDHPSYSGKTYKLITMMYKQTIYDLSTTATALSLPLLNAATALELTIKQSFNLFCISYGLNVDTGYYSGVASTVSLKAGHTGGAVGTGGSAGSLLLLLLFIIIIYFYYLFLLLGFTYVLSLAESLLEWNSASPTFTGSCLGFKYYYIDSSISTNNEYKYGIFCSLSAGVIISSIKNNIWFNINFLFSNCNIILQP